MRRRCITEERLDLWVLSRFDDVQAAAKDWATFSSSAGGMGNDIDDTYQLFLPAGDLAGVDPPLHTRLRGALRLAFSPSALRARFEPIVRRKVVELIDAFADEGRADFARDLARPLPGTTMFSWFGFPEADHPQLLAWFGDMLERDTGERALPARSKAGRDQLRAYMQDAARERRSAPREDLMSFLVAAEEAGEISADELLGSSMLLFVAGITTTSGLISNSLLHLDRFPDQRDLLRSQPSILPSAIEELLRFDAPIQALARTATREVALHGAVIPEGARVALVWASANRDERHWADPDGSTSCATRSATSPSVRGSITAWGLRSPGSRRRSPSRSSSGGSRRTRSAVRSSGSRPRRTGRSSPCRSRSEAPASAAR